MKWAFLLRFGLCQGQIPFAHELGNKRVGVVENLNVDDFHVVVNLDNRGSEHLHQLSRGLLALVRSCPLCPMPPAEGHLGWP